MKEVRNKEEHKNDVKSLIINSDIKQQIEELVFERDSKKLINLGHYGLDFSKEYIYFGTTKKTVKLGWINGSELVMVQGKVEDRGDYFALYTEGWSFIEHLPKIVDPDVEELDNYIVGILGVRI